MSHEPCPIIVAVNVSICELRFIRSSPLQTNQVTYATTPNWSSLGRAAGKQKASVKYGTKFLATVCVRKRTQVRARTQNGHKATHRG